MTDRLTISADMLAVLTSEHGDNDSIGAYPQDGLESDDAPITWSVPAGNVAANVYNVTQGGGLEGLNLGWKGMDASTSFLCRIVSSVDEAWTEVLDGARILESNNVDTYEVLWDALRNNGRDHEIADGAVPVATIEVLRAAIELQCTSVEKNHFDDLGYLTEEISMERIGAVALYELASSIVSSLMDALIAHDAKREDVDA